MPETLFTNQDALRRLLVVAASACVALFGWSASRELHQIGESTRSTNAHVSNLDQALRGLLVESASTSRRLEYLEEMARSNRARIDAMREHE